MITIQLIGSEVCQESIPHKHLYLYTPDQYFRSEEDLFWIFTVASHLKFAPTTAKL